MFDVWYDKLRRTLKNQFGIRADATQTDIEEKHIAVKKAMV